MFSFIGWPNMAVRIITRILLMPLVEAYPMEIIKWAGRSEACLQKVVRSPGMFLQGNTAGAGQRPAGGGYCLYRAVAGEKKGYRSNETGHGKGLGQRGFTRLKQAGVDGPRLDAELLLAKVLGKDRFLHQAGPLPGGWGSARISLSLSSEGPPATVRYLTGVQGVHGA